VNRQIARVAGAAMGLLVLLVVATTYWQTWARPALAERQDNEVQRVAQFEIERGEITADGRRLARNREREVAGRTLFFRRYPQGPLTAHVVGYSTQSRSRAGLERSLNDYLTASNEDLSSFVETSLDKLRGKPILGNDVRLTLDLDAQRVALDALGATCGAVAALDPRNGRVKVLASSPSYNPNLVESRFGEIERIRADCADPAPLINRATAGLYPPGSIFKVVTASAALDSGRFTAASTFDDPGYCVAYGRRVNNFDTSSPFGRHTLATALQYSVNSTFCKIGQALGAKRILDEAKDFGFYELPPLETPEDERRASGLYSQRGRELYYPKRDSDVDAGRMAFGQERLLVTPLQLAMVAGTIGNAGILMRPHAVDRIVSPDREPIVETRRHRIRRAVEPATAAAVGEMMVRAVEAGTGTSARISGLRVGGKTGTAETGVDGRNVTWFIAFAGPPDERPKAAIAVVLENQTLTGGATAAPIAREVLQALLEPAANT
jgi:peptidoglycan glycosyltransferase